MGNGCNKPSAIEVIGNTSKIQPGQLKQIKAINIQKYSKTVFDAFNHIRQNIQKYSAFLDNIYAANSSLDKNNFPSELEGKVFEHLITFIKSHEEEKNIMKEFSEHLKTTSSSEPVIWSLSVHEIVSKKLSKAPAKDCITEINKALNKNLCCCEFALEKYYEAEFAIWHIFLEHKERFIQLLKENYVCGSVATHKSNGFKTTLILLSENTKIVEIDGNNPVTGAKEPLSLNEPFFKDLAYKPQIIGGNYIYSGDTLNVTFKLFNGEVKEENINL